MRGVLVEDEAVIVRTYLDRMTALGLRREHFGVVRSSGRT
jgi:hypothetical protein